MKSIQYLDRTILRSPHFCLILDEKVYKKELTRVGIATEEQIFCPIKFGAHIQTIEKDNKICCFVSMRGFETSTIEETFAVLAHETTHVWQELKKSIGENCPGVETEAYAIQNICQELFESFNKQTKRKYMHLAYQSKRKKIK